MLGRQEARLGSVLMSEKIFIQGLFKDELAFKVAPI